MSKRAGPTSLPDRLRSAWAALVDAGIRPSDYIPWPAWKVYVADATGTGTIVSISNYTAMLEDMGLIRRVAGGVRVRAPDGPRTPPPTDAPAARAAAIPQG